VIVSILQVIIVVWCSALLTGLAALGHVVCDGQRQHLVKRALHPVRDCYDEISNNVFRNNNLIDYVYTVFVIFNINPFY